MDVIGRTLTLKGMHKEDNVTDGDETNIRVERHRMSSFERTIRLPVQVDPTKVNASLNHGILEVSIGKLAASVGGRVPIMIQ